MKNFITLTISVILFATGCEHTRRPTYTPVRTTDPNVKAAIKQHDEQIAKLTFQFNQILESNKTLVGHINRLNKEIAGLERKIGLLEQSNTTLTNQLKAEQLARKSDIEKLLKEVAKQIAAALNRRTGTSSTSTSSGSNKGPVGKGEFYEYTVQQGATLGAIARAYKVSVSDIKKANNLKSDMIRVGQKLYIPKK